MPGCTTRRSAKRFCLHHSVLQESGNPDLIPLLQLFVLSYGLDALRFAARKINLHQNEILGAGVILELLLGENRPIELKTKPHQSDR